MIREISEGRRYLTGRRVLLCLAGLSVVTNVAYMLPFSILVLYATEVLDLQPVGYGAVLTVSALGSLLGSVTAPTVLRLLGTTATVGGTLIIGAVAYAVPAATSSVVPATAMLALYFFYSTIWSITVASLRQTLIPHHLLGRVAGVNRAFSLAGLLVGSLAGGALAAGFGLRSPFWCAAVLLALAGLATFPLLRHLDPRGPHGRHP